MKKREIIKKIAETEDLMSGWLQATAKQALKHDDVSEMKDVIMTIADQCQERTIELQLRATYGKDVVDFCKFHRNLPVIIEVYGDEIKELCRDATFLLVNENHDVIQVEKLFAIWWNTKKS